MLVLDVGRHNDPLKCTEMFTQGITHPTLARDKTAYNVVGSLTITWRGLVRPSTSRQAITALPLLNIHVNIP